MNWKKSWSKIKTKYWTLSLDVFASILPTDHSKEKMLQPHAGQSSRKFWSLSYTYARLKGIKQHLCSSAVFVCRCVLILLSCSFCRKRPLEWGCSPWPSWDRPDGSWLTWRITRRRSRAVQCASARDHHRSVRLQRQTGTSLTEPALYLWQFHSGSSFIISDSETLNLLNIFPHRSLLQN